MLLLLAGDAWAQDFTPEDLAGMAAMREASLGLQRMYVDETHYYFHLPDHVVTEEWEWRGALLWRFDGMELFSDVPDTLVPQTFIEQDYVLTGLEYDPDGYLGVGTAERSDRYGRRWVLEAVDVDAARAIVEADEKAAAAWNGEEAGVEPNPGVELNPDGGTEHTVLPTSWDVVTCSGTNRFYDHSGNGDMTQANPVPMNERQRKIVLIWGSESCTGTMIDANTLLTAAHCVTNSSGVDYPASTFTVCTMENLDENISGLAAADCFGVTDVDTAPSWVDDTPFVTEYDYALLHLDGTPGNGWFELSSASDATINGPTDFLRGYPIVERDCDTNTVTNEALTTVNTWNGRQMYAADGEVQSTPVGYVKWDTSVALGVSGGPHFYCPTGDCANGHYQTGVQSVVWISCANPPCSSGYIAGPKARDIESWVDLNK